MRSIHVTVCALLFSSACQSRAPKPVDPQAAAKPVVESMQEHFSDLERLQDFIIIGDLDGAKKQAATLDAHVAAMQAPASWGPGLKTFRAAAAQGMAAIDLPAAAAAASGMARACGACHDSLGVDLATRITVAPTVMDATPADALDEFMWRHEQAAHLMWRALVSPSDEHWAEATRLLARTVWLRKAAQAQVGAGAALQEFAETLTELDDSARSASSAAQREQVYGRFLATCAGCHVEHRKQPLQLTPMAAPPPGTVEQSPDALTESEATERIRESHSAVLDCWKRHGHRDDGSTNRFTLAVIVGKNGRVSRFSYDFSPKEPTAFRACLAPVIDALRFPVKSFVTEVRYPYNFQRTVAPGAGPMKR